MQDAFDVYLKELLLWNKKYNLTSITSPEEIKIKHFEDSLTILQVIDLKDEKVADIGSGAGFPGIPLKIKRPGIKLTLIEATRKKTEFLKYIVKILDLSDIEVVWGRAEELAGKYAGKFDVVLARAVSKLPELVKFTLPYLRKGGIFIAQKGSVVENADKEIKKYGGQIEKIHKFFLSNGDPRTLAVIRKY